MTEAGFSPEPIFPPSRFRCFPSNVNRRSRKRPEVNPKLHALVKVKPRAKLLLPSCSHQKTTIYPSPVIPPSLPHTSSFPTFCNSITLFGGGGGTPDERQVYTNKRNLTPLNLGGLGKKNPTTSSSRLRLHTHFTVVANQLVSHTPTHTLTQTHNPFQLCKIQSGPG